MGSLRGSAMAPVGGREKVLGRAAYVDDVAVDGMLHAAVIRSPHAHAHVKGITLDLKVDWEDVTVITAADIPLHNALWLGDAQDQPVLAAETVRHAGQAVVVTAAPTVERARRAAADIRVRYRELTPLLDATRSEDHALLLTGTNNVFHRVTLERGHSSATGAGVRVEGTWSLGAQDHVPLEPCGVIAVPSGSKMTLYGGFERPEWAQETIQRVLGISDCVVVPAAVGGSFGRRGALPVQLAAQAALLATVADRPVKLQLDRREELLAAGKRHPGQVRLAVRVDEVGRLHGVEGHVLLDGGAYATRSAEVLEVVMRHILGPYHCANVLVHGVVVATNRPPNERFYGLDEAAAAFAMERLLDRVARVLALDPSAVRQANLLRQGDVLHTGETLANGAGMQVLEAAQLQAETPAPPPTRTPVGAKLLAGRGVALGMLAASPRPPTGRVALELRKERVRVLLPLVDTGTGDLTRAAQVVGDALGLSVDQLLLRPSDTSRLPPGLARPGEVFDALERAAVRLHRAVETELGQTGEFSALLRVARSKRVRVDEGLRTPEQLAPGWTCAVVDVVVDADTGEVGLRRIVTATAGPEPIHPKLARTQLEGAVVRGLGAALTEKLYEGPQGWRGAHLAGIPTALDVPRLDTLLVPMDAPTSPYGYGHIGAVAIPAAIAQAIESATGADVTCLPLSPQAVLEALP